MDQEARMVEKRPERNPGIELPAWRSSSLFYKMRTFELFERICDCDCFALKRKSEHAIHDRPLIKLTCEGTLTGYAFSLKVSLVRTMERSVQTKTLELSPLSWKHLTMKASGFGSSMVSRSCSGCEM